MGSIKIDGLKKITTKQLIYKSLLKKFPDNLKII